MQNYKHLVHCDKSISVDKLCKHSSTLLNLKSCVNNKLLKSPDNENTIFYKKNTESVLTDGINEYPIFEGIPILHPVKVRNEFLNIKNKHKNFKDSLLQYYLLNYIKSSISPNAPPDCLGYERHLYRINDFCKNLSGLILDIGCDNTIISSSVYPDSCSYIGIDPSLNSESFKISGIAEILPFNSEIFDSVIFNTSLDHILDYHSALDEAMRVLKKGGSLIIDTYVWEQHATLLHDIVHFHHFRYDQLMCALKSLDCRRKIMYECPKGDSHRHELLIEMIK